MVFALDASGSIGQESFKLMTDFVVMAVQSLDMNGRATSDHGTRIGLMTFGDVPQLHFNLNEYLTSDTELLGALNVKYSRGTTNTAGAIKYD